MKFKIGNSGIVKVITLFDGNDIYGISEELKKYVKENKLFNGKRGEIFSNLGPNSENVILLGLGKEDEISLENIRRAFLSLGKHLKANNVKSCNIEIKKFDGICYKLTAQAMIEGIINVTYAFDNFLKEKKDKFDCEVFFTVLENKIEHVESGIKEIEAIKKQIESLKMDAFLSVAQGSDLPPKFIIMKHLPNKDEKPIVLVGKGLTYDSGGYAIKPATGMVTMKTDMGGSASVISTMYAVGKMKVQRNVIALVASCENMINGHAYRNGDIISSMKGSTIEVINTDAEGRLTLADAIYYGASKLNPECIIDVATLTGACIQALGSRVIGAVSNSDEVFAKIKESADFMGEYLWRFPVYEEHKESVKGKVGDLLNVTAPGTGGAITAGVFLEHFVENTPWVHLDIAGPSYSNSAWGTNPEGASGTPVKTLYNFVKKYNKK